MELGGFSVCLAVKDILASKDFYEKLGFTQMSGDISQNWAVLKNGYCKIGIFQGMFPKNILAFSPGWDQDAQALASFTDIRSIQKALKDKGLKLSTEADERTKGPASFTLEDPDGNAILFDQYV